MMALLEAYIPLSGFKSFFFYNIGSFDTFYYIVVAMTTSRIKVSFIY